MGNSLHLPCVCTAAGDARSWKRKKTACWRNTGRRAAASHVVPVDMPPEEVNTKAAWPTGLHVEPVVDNDGGGGVRVKIVMKRKEAKELVARLVRRDAADRKARMEELNNELGGGGNSFVAAAVTMMCPPCRPAGWQPRLASIPEN